MCTPDREFSPYCYNQTTLQKSQHVKASHHTFLKLFFLHFYIKLYNLERLIFKRICQLTDKFKDGGMAHKIKMWNWILCGSIIKYTKENVSAKCHVMKGSKISLSRVRTHHRVRTATLRAGQGQNCQWKCIHRMPRASVHPTNFHAQDAPTFHYQLHFFFRFSKIPRTEFQVECGTAELLRVLHQPHTVLGEFPTLLLILFPFHPKSYLISQRLLHTPTTAIPWPPPQTWGTPTPGRQT